MLQEVNQSGKSTCKFPCYLSPQGYDPKLGISWTPTQALYIFFGIFYKRDVTHDDDKIVLTPQ